MVLVIPPPPAEGNMGQGRHPCGGRRAVMVAPGQDRGVGAFRGWASRRCCVQMGAVVLRRAAVWPAPTPGAAGQGPSGVGWGSTAKRRPSAAVWLVSWHLRSTLEPFKVVLLTGNTSDMLWRSGLFIKALRFLAFQIAFILQFSAKNQRVELQIPIISALTMNLCMRSKYRLIFLFFYRSLE